LETLRALGSGIVAFVGSVDGKAGIAAAVSKDVAGRGAAADEIGRSAAGLLGGNISKGAELAVGGGKDAGAVDVALSTLRERAAEWRQ
jgi:alanyl-tRNA synthetase